MASSIVDVKRRLIAAFSASILLGSAYGQLLSCSEINCPVDQFHVANCQINGSKIPVVGFTNFSSSLSSEPLGWTVGFNPNYVTDAPDERIYILSTPPTIELDSVNTFSGCALFFTGVEAGLHFMQQDAYQQYMPKQSGTCQDALGEACVSDLLQQAGNVTTEMQANGNFTCLGVVQALQNLPPTTCTRSGTWGNVTALDLTGPKTPPKLQSGDCNPTQNQTFESRLVATIPSIFDHDYVNDITPLMTVLVPTVASEKDLVGPQLTSPEVHLSCMKPIADPPPNLTVAGSGDKLGLPVSSMALSVLLIAMSVIVL